MRRFRSLAVTVLLGLLLVVLLPIWESARALQVIIVGLPPVFIDNGLAPPEPDNIIDAEDDYSLKSVVVRNAGCPPPKASYSWDPCPSPGEATEVALVTGGYIEGGLYTRDTSTITISGGTTHSAVCAHDASKIFVSGGSLESDLQAYETSRITLAGGTVRGQLRVFESGRIWIVGSGFQLDGIPVPFGDLIADSGTLTGTLASGDSLDNAFRNGWTESSITLVSVSDPTTALPRGWKVVLCHTARTGSERSLLASSGRIQKHLDHGDSWGECPDSTRVALCHTTKKGTQRTLLLATRMIDRHLSHGDTPGECPLPWE